MAPLVQIAAVTMAPDASWAISVSADGTVRTWGSGVAPRVIRQAVPIRGQPAAVALSGDRVRVLWAAGETIRLHENVTGAWPRDVDFPASAPVRALALSPSGVLAAVACTDGSLRTLNAGTGEFGPPLATGGLTARAVAVASDRGPVVAAFEDGLICRYDLAAGTSEVVGSGPGIELLAVSPDGGAVIAVGADGTLLRWNRSGAASPDHRTLGTAVTAIAIDGTGRQVLAGHADGTLWRHDMAGGPAVEFTASTSPPAPSPPAPSGWWYQPEPAASAPERSAPAASAPPAPPPTLGKAAPWAPADPGLVDDDVRFTVYRPETLSPGVWESLLVFAHKTDLVEEPGKPPLDPNEQVEAIARAHFGNMPVRQSGEDARVGVFRGARLRITVDLPGIVRNPDSAEFDWWEPVHHVVFRLLAPPDLAGSVVRGSVRIWCGPLILGEVSLALRVTASALAAAPPPTVAESAPRYRKIFPSYSHADGAIVDGFAEIVRTFGDEYLRDVVAIRSGERWRERLPELIAEADVFQLFWSSNSMRSRYCREEWEHALALGRPFFVRPFYWEDPRPEDPANGLPPAALDALEFVKVSLYSAQREVPVFRGADPGSTADAGLLEGERAEDVLDDAQRLHTEVHSRRPSVESIRLMLSRLTTATSSTASPYEAAGPPSPLAGHRRPAAGRRRLAVAALVLAVIAVAVLIALRFLG